VHVGCGARHLTKGWRLESAPIVRIARYGKPPLIVDPAVADSDASIVKLLVGEVRPGMAAEATGLPSEQLQPALPLR